MAEKGIKLVRIDARLLHATVQLYWTQFIDVKQIWIINPEYAADSFISSVIQLCLPKSIEIKIYRPDELVQLCQKEGKFSAIVIFSDIHTAKNTVELGFHPDEIQLPYPASKGLLKSIKNYFTPEEIDSLTHIQKAGIKLYFQTSPYDTKTYFTV